MSEPLEVSSTQELQLIKAAASTSDFVESTSVGLVMCDQTGKILECNDAAADFFQLEQSDLVGKTRVAGVRLQDLHGDLFPDDERPSPKSFREQRALKNIVIGIDIPDKPIRWARVSTNLADAGCELQGVLATWVDCTAEIERGRILNLGLEMLGKLDATSDPSELLQSLCDTLVDNGRYPLAWIGTDVEGGRGRVEVSFSAGAIDYLFDGIVSLSSSEPNGKGPTASAFNTQEVAIAPDLASGYEYEFWRDRVHQFGFSSAVAVPFRTNRSHVLTVYDRHADAFDETKITGIVQMTNAVAQRAQVLATLTEVRRNLEGTIAALGQITEERDPYTEGHQTRVGELSAAIARDLGIDGEAVDIIRLAGEVHDVGKISVPAEILTRPGRLRALEFEMIKRHCEVGANILLKASLPPVFADVARQHHERLDGSGYPFGLVDDQIGMPARIVAVSDVIEAMMHHRPYRPAPGLDAALKVITQGSGNLFDAEVVAACVAQFEAGFEFSRRVDSSVSIP
jgi:putative nucleotidyltransferase with HDIG domain